jgi:predicted ATPase
LHVADEQLVIDGPGFQNTTLLQSNGREAHMLHEDSSEGYTAKTLAPADATMLSKLYELDTNRRAIAFRRYLSSWYYFALNPAAMRFGWSRAPSLGAGLDVHGDNLATVLYRVKNLNERLYRHVVKDVQMVEPTLEAVNFIVSPEQTVTPFVELRDQSRASWVGLSDGTLRCLGLAFIVETVGEMQQADSGAPPVVIIEEPENGIYPGQLRRMFDLFEERAPLGQFIFTSHSPYFINLFDGYRESVTLLKRENERTKIVRVPSPDDDPDRPLLADEYSMELIG